MGLREEIEAALAEAAADGGVRQLTVDGDEEVWVAGLGVTDGRLEVSVGDRGPRRGLRRRRPDPTVMAAQGFRSSGDAWILLVPPGPGQATRGAAAAVSALVDGLGVPAGAHAAVTFTQRGAKDLVAAVDAIASRAEEIAFVGAPGGPTVVSLIPAGDRVRVQTLWDDDDKPLALPGFDHDDDERLSTRDVEPDEAVAAARIALGAHGVDAGGPLLIHLGA
ncbi:MAG TPA: hypothetical protein VH834_02680 [Solirubrobacteraceae bacterium]|jgi:hypothetical protein